MSTNVLPSDTQDVSPGGSTLNPFDDDANHLDDSMKDAPQDTDGPIDPSMILYVDKTVTLTIAAESLVVLDENIRNRRDTRNCFGLLARWTKTTRAIPFRNVLWAEIKGADTIVVDYARPVGRKGSSCRVDKIEYCLEEKADHAHAAKWVAALLERAYPGPIKREKRMKIVINPFGGQGHAQKIWTNEVEPIFAAARCKLDVEATTHQGHAIDIAEALDVDAYDVIAAASGDGLPHEIFNGLSKQKRPRRALRNLPVTQIPCGSGNALCLNTLKNNTPSWAAVEIVKGLPAPLDLMAVTQGDRQFYSFLSQAVGIIAESDLGTENLRWMGSLRFQWGVLVRLFGKTIYPAEVSIATLTQDKERITEMQKTGQQLEANAWQQREGSPDKALDSSLPQLVYGTINDPLPSAFETIDHPNLGNFYTGNMPIMTADTTFFPAALLQDGLADVITIQGDISRVTSLNMLLSVESGGIIDFPEVDYRKAHAYRISPRMATDADDGRQTLRYRFVQWLGGAGDQKEGLIAIDGEKMPFEPFQVEVHQGLGTTLMRSAHLFAGQT